LCPSPPLSCDQVNRPFTLQGSMGWLIYEIVPPENWDCLFPILVIKDLKSKLVSKFFTWVWLTLASSFATTVVFLLILCIIEDSSQFCGGIDKQSLAVVLLHNWLFVIITYITYQTCQTGV
jgi:hypothetical protein